MKTPCGDFKITRNVDYCPPCGRTYPQGDKELGIADKIRATDDFIEIAAFIAQLVPSYTDASKVLSKTMGVYINESQLKKIVDYVGSRVHNKQMKKAEESYNKPEIAMSVIPEREKRDLTLYITTDGSAVNTRIQDEDGSTWKEMKLGMTFLDEDIKKKKDGTFRIKNKEYVAYLGSVNEFKKLLFESAIKAGYGKVKKVVVLGDGAIWIWNMCKELFPDAICILDLFHMKEKIFDHAKLLFPNNEKKYKKWAETVSYYIETEQVKKALKKIENNPLPTAELEKKVNLHGYIINNLERVKYLEYKNKGFYVGSGMIESGNKVVVQKRMKQAGQRWSKDGAQNMVVLRAKYESGDWQEVKTMLLAGRKPGTRRKAA